MGPILAFIFVSYLLTREVTATFSPDILHSIFICSLDVGKNAKAIQYETTRKLCSHISTFVHTTPSGLGQRFMSTDSGSLTVSFSPTNSEWFRRFMLGCHKRMGDVWIPDQPNTIKEILKALNILKEDWEAYENDPHGRLTASLSAVVFVAGFFGALRGEELVRIDFSFIRKHWAESVSNDIMHVPLMLSGRFKREVGEKVLSIFSLDHTVRC